MEELYRSIGTNRYPIACKLCVPDGEVRGAILSAHGFASSKDSATQKAVVRAGTRHGLSVLCFDFPAHGESEVGEDRLTVEKNIILQAKDAALRMRRRRPFLVSGYSAFIRGSSLRFMPARFFSCLTMQTGQRYE